MTVERVTERAARITRNAAALGVPGLRVVTGSAPDALAGLPAPDAVFIGGGLTAPGLLDAAWEALAPGGGLSSTPSPWSRRRYSPTATAATAASW